MIQTDDGVKAVPPDGWQLLLPGREEKGIKGGKFTVLGSFLLLSFPSVFDIQELYSYSYSNPFASQTQVSLDHFTILPHVCQHTTTFSPTKHLTKLLCHF